MINSGYNKARECRIDHLTGASPPNRRVERQENKHRSRRGHQSLTTIKHVSVEAVGYTTQADFENSRHNPQQSHSEIPVFPASNEGLADDKGVFLGLEAG